MLDTMHVGSVRFDLLLEVEEGGVEPIETLDDLCENFDDLSSNTHDEFTNVDSETELDSDTDFELSSLEAISDCENHLTNCTHIRNAADGDLHEMKSPNLRAVVDLRINSLGSRAHWDALEQQLLLKDLFSEYAGRFVKIYKDDLVVYSNDQNTNHVEKVTDLQNLVIIQSHANTHNTGDFLHHLVNVSEVPACGSTHQYAADLKIDENTVVSETPTFTMEGGSTQDFDCSKSEVDSSPACNTDDEKTSASEADIEIEGKKSVAQPREDPADPSRLLAPTSAGPNVAFNFCCAQDNHKISFGDLNEEHEL
jgi:hypothetical protein